MTFARYYKPAIVVIAAGVQIVNLDDEGLRVAFDVTRSIASEPNRCRVRVWGLSAERRAAVREIHRIAGATPLEVLVGWDRITKRIFSGLGERVTIDATTTGPGFLEVEAGDGSAGYGSAIVEFATYGITPLELVQLYAAPALLEFVPGVTATVAPSTTVRLSPTAIATLSSAEAITVGTFGNGYAFSGTARELLDEVCRTIGARWWIDDGILEVVPSASPLPGQAIVLGPPSGLLERPRPSDVDAIELDALLDPDALPGRLVVVQDDVGAPVGEPAYRIETGRYYGDTAPGGPWRMQLVARGGLVLL